MKDFLCFGGGPVGVLSINDNAVHHAPSRLNVTLTPVVTMDPMEMERAADAAHIVPIDIHLIDGFRERCFDHDYEDSEEDRGGKARGKQKQRDSQRIVPSDSVAQA